MIEASQIALIFALPLFGLTFFSRLLLRSFLELGAFFSIYWFIETVLPIFLLPRDPVNIMAVLWIMLASSAVLAGNIIAIMAQPNPTGRVSEQRTLPYPGPLSGLVIICIILGIGSTVMALKSAAWLPASLFSIEGIIGAARFFSLGRYDFTYQPTFLTQVFLVFVYTGPLFGGLLGATARQWRYKAIGLFSIFPALLITILETRRSVLLAAIFMWVSVYLSLQLFLGKLHLFTKRRISFYFLTVTIMFFIAVGAGFARLGTTDIMLVDVALSKAYEAIFGHIAVFSNWFHGLKFFTINPSFGVFTMAGIFDALGMHHREAGLFTDMVTLASGDTSNLFTFFRPLIEDFTPGGALLGLILFGFLGRLTYTQVKMGKLFYLPLLSAFYLTVLYSFITSIWIYNSIIASYGLFTLGLALLPKLSVLRRSSF